MPSVSSYRYSLGKKDQSSRAGLTALSDWLRKLQLDAVFYRSVAGQACLEAMKKKFATRNTWAPTGNQHMRHLVQSLVIISPCSILLFTNGSRCPAMWVKGALPKYHSLVIVRGWLAVFCLNGITKNLAVMEFRK